MFVSVRPVDWQVRPSDRSAVPQTAVMPAATPVTVVEYSDIVSEIGFAVAMPVL
jgi:hypothetical protein